MSLEFCAGINNIKSFRSNCVFLVCGNRILGCYMELLDQLINLSSSSKVNSTFCF